VKKYDITRRDDIDKKIVIDNGLDQRLRELRDFTLLDDDDAVIFIDGKEGSGKSQAARQIGYLLAKWSNRPFGVKNVHNSLSSYMNWVMRTEDDNPDKDKPGRVSILDEGKKILNKMRQMSSSNVKWTDFMSENRNFNVFHIICAPAFHDIDPNTATWRTKLLVHMMKETEDTDNSDYMSGKTLKRGGYEYYDAPMLRHIYSSDYRYFEDPSGKGHLRDVDTLTQEEQGAYEKQKRKEMRNKYGENSGFADKTTRIVGACLRYMKSESMMSKACEYNKDVLEVPKRTFRYHVNKWIDDKYDAEEAASN